MASFDFPTLGVSAGRWCVNYKSCTTLLLKLLGFWLVIHYNSGTNESSPILNFIENMSKIFSRGNCLIQHLVCAIWTELKTSGKQHQNPCSGSPLIYQDLSMYHVYGLVKNPKLIWPSGWKEISNDFLVIYLWVPWGTISRILALLIIIIIIIMMIIIIIIIIGLRLCLWHRLSSIIPSLISIIHCALLEGSLLNEKI